MNTLVLGLGKSGEAAVAYLRERGDHVVVYDDHLDSNPVDLASIDLIVKSPGVPLSHPLIAGTEIPIIGEIDLALAELEGKKTVYGVTGSNGKTTTTLFATHLLKCAGKKAVAAGNVGTPLLSLIHEEVDVFVVEMSSFQLETIEARPVLDGAVILNLTPNHLDRHGSFDAYITAKLRIKELLKENAPLHMPPFEADFEGFYAHDLENIAAAAKLTGLDPAIGLKTFTKPPHRLEFVRVVDGVHYINDSKATSVAAVVRALDALSGKVVLIAGGKDKGAGYEAWLNACSDKVRKVLAIGEASERIAATLAPKIAVERVDSLATAVKKAAEYAQSGETVLLSPGCSSYDQFQSYEERGEKFKQLISALEEKQK